MNLRTEYLGRSLPLIDKEEQQRRVEGKTNRPDRKALRIERAEVIYQNPFRGLDWKQVSVLTQADTSVTSTQSTAINIAALSNPDCNLLSSEEYISIASQQFTKLIHNKNTPIYEILLNVSTVLPLSFTSWEWTLGQARETSLKNIPVELVQLISQLLPAILAFRSEDLYKYIRGTLKPFTKSFGTQRLYATLHKAELPIAIDIANLADMVAPLSYPLQLETLLRGLLPNIKWDDPEYTTIIQSLTSSYRDHSYTTSETSSQPKAGSDYTDPDLSDIVGDHVIIDTGNGGIYNNMVDTRIEIEIEEDDPWDSVARDVSCKDNPEWTGKGTPKDERYEVDLGGGVLCEYPRLLNVEAPEDPGQILSDYIRVSQTGLVLPILEGLNIRALSGLSDMLESLQGEERTEAMLMVLGGEVYPVGYHSNNKGERLQADNPYTSFNVVGSLRKKIASTIPNLVEMDLKACYCNILLAMYPGKLLALQEVVESPGGIWKEIESTCGLPKKVVKPIVYSALHGGGFKLATKIILEYLVESQFLVDLVDSSEIDYLRQCKAISLAEKVMALPVMKDVKKGLRYIQSILLPKVKNKQVSSHTYKFITGKEMVVTKENLLTAIATYFQSYESVIMGYVTLSCLDTAIPVLHHHDGGQWILLEGQDSMNKLVLATTYITNKLIGKTIPLIQCSCSEVI